LFVRREAHRLAIAAAEPTVDKRIEHQPQKLGHQLEGATLGISRHLARQLRQHIRQARSAQSEDGCEVRRQRTAAVVEIVESVRDVLLIAIEAAAGAEGRGKIIEQYVVGRVTQAGAAEIRQIHRH
jgi:UDP-N-acetyl-D-mannosaminuronic acid transferase (WecB/TagA/CpsF family)